MPPLVAAAENGAEAAVARLLRERRGRDSFDRSARGERFGLAPRDDRSWGTVWIPKLQPDFNVRVLERFGPSSLVVLRELDQGNRFVLKSAESTLI